MPMTALTSPETSCPSACVTPVHASLHQEPSTIPSHGPDPTTRQLYPFVSLHLNQNQACHFYQCDHFTPPYNSKTLSHSLISPGALSFFPFLDRQGLRCLLRHTLSFFLITVRNGKCKKGRIFYVIIMKV